jgi:hypothetical protein
LDYYLSPAAIVKNQKFGSWSFKARFSSAWTSRYEIMALPANEFVHGAFAILQHTEDVAKVRVEGTRPDRDNRTLFMRAGKQTPTPPRHRLRNKTKIKTVVHQFAKEQDKERDKIFTILGELDQKRRAVTGSRHMIEIGSNLLIGPNGRFIRGRHR